MPRKIFYFPASEPDRRELLEKLDCKHESIDALRADSFLGLAAQDRCGTREELIAYAWDESLVPYLRFFLERRGWLDDDWDRLVDEVTRQFQKQVH